MNGNSNIIDILKSMQPSLAAGEKPAPTEPEPVPEKEPEDIKTGSLRREGKGIRKTKGASKTLEHSFDEVIRHTEKATLFRVAENQYWLPKSKYFVDDKTPAGHVSAPRWLEINLKPYRKR